MMYGLKLVATNPNTLVKERKNKNKEEEQEEMPHEYKVIPFFS